MPVIHDMDLSAKKGTDYSLVCPDTPVGASRSEIKSVIELRA